MNSAGVIVVNYTYSTYGETVSITGYLASTLGAINPYRYRGYRFDTETGYYYLQSRYYNPQIGRFINADGIVGSLGSLSNMNMFAYCNNNVVSSSDSSGNIAVGLDNEVGYFKAIASQIVLPETFIGVEQSVSANYDQHRSFGSIAFIEIRQGKVRTELISKTGEQNGILNFYSEVTSENPLGSSVGVNLNILGAYCGSTLGYKDTGLNLGISNKDESGEISVGVSFETLSVNLKLSHKKQNGNRSATNYTSISFSPVIIIAIYYSVTTGDLSILQKSIFAD